MEPKLRTYEEYVIFGQVYQGEGIYYWEEFMESDTKLFDPPKSAEEAMSQLELMREDWCQCVDWKILHRLVTVIREPVHGN